MNRIDRCNVGDLAGVTLPAEWGLPSHEAMAQHAPDVTLVRRAGDGVRAMCSLWWTHAPPLERQRVGAVGHFGAADAEGACEILDEAARVLSERGCSIAVGPMDGNTWRRYRLVTDAGDEPPFFLEPTNPVSWPGHWRAAGFTPLAKYLSGLNADLGQRDPRAAAAAERLAANGVRVRPLDPARFEEELHRIYAVAEVSFQQNYLYTPLPESAFASQYHSIRALVVPELVLIAEHGDRPVGFAFSIPDVNEKLRGATVRTVIVKTVAILPERHLLGGLGSLMTDITHATARDMGFVRAIHALMHESNASLAISARTGRVMRRYTLFSRALS